MTAPLSMAALVARHAARPVPRAERAWQRRELRGYGWELRQGDKVVVRVRQSEAGCIVRTMEAGHDSKPMPAAAAEAMAERIARLACLP